MLPKRIENKIDKTTGCWLWLACIDRGGYGVVSWGGKACRAHRVVYELLIGKTTLELDHLCRVHNCVNPAHLEPVTHNINVQRGLAPNTSSSRWSKPRNCPHGHPLYGNNLYEHYSLKYKRLNRQCKICKRISKQKRRANGAKN